MLNNAEDKNMVKSLFYLVSGYLWQLLLYTTCEVDISQIPVYLMILLWVLLSLMTYLFFETVLKNGMIYKMNHY